MGAPDDAASALVAQARSHLGGAPGELKRGRDPVNLPMVHHWCQALDDRNPAYLDEDFARASARGQLVAPPGMLQTWIMDAPRDGVMGSNDQVMRLLDDAGYTSVVAVNYEHEYLRELLHGERISVRSAAEDLSEEKKTALGMGYFTTVRHEYVTDDGELVGVGRMRMLKFKPPSSGASAAPPAADAAPDLGTRAAPAIGRDNQYFWDGIAQEQLLLQRCGGCHQLRHPASPLCPSCHSAEWTAVPASGLGVVYSFVVHHYPPLPGVERPHTVLLVELEEGLRFMSELAKGSDPSLVRVGLPVELVFQEVPGGMTLPAFRPATEETA